MARLESEGKGGYYPTPPEEMKLILKRVSIPKGKEVTIFDPCCGKGHAINQWQKDLIKKGAQAAHSYGIELEKSRATEAKRHVDHVLNCGYEESRLSHEAFSAMYLNPPFMRVGGDRLEYVFLRDLTAEYLGEGSLFIFNLPQHVLKDCARILGSRFTDLKVYRFSDANYDNYKQVIVYGYRRAKGLRSLKEREYQQAITKKLENIASRGKDALPSLDTPDWDEVQYNITVQAQSVDIFTSTRVDLDDILHSQQESDFNENVEKKLFDLSMLNGGKITPAMPLKITHVATAIASGSLPEGMGDHLLVGVTQQVKEEKVQINPRSGKEEEVTTLRPKSTVRIFSEKGIFNLK